MKHSVLVVEDSATQAHALSMLLEQSEFEVTVARSGEAALERLTAQRFDIVVSDVMMPGITGYELCRQIKDDPALRDMPVLLLTTLNDPIDIVRGLESQADNYITKPYDPDQLLARIRRMLDGRRAPSEARVNDGVAIEFLGRTYMIRADRQQILDLLLSSVEDIVRSNHTLEARQNDLARAHSQLASYAREKALEARVSTERYRALMRDASDAIVLFDEAGTILEANLRTADILGRPLEQLLWRPLGSVLSDDERPAFESALADLMQAGILPPRDGIIVGGDGVRRYIEFSASGTHIDGQRFFLGIARDVTAQRESTERLRSSERLLAEAQHVAGLGSWEWLLHTNQVQGSAELARIFGMPLDTLAISDGESLFAAVHADEQARVYEAVQVMLAGGEPLNVEFRFTRADGTLRIGHGRGELVRDEEGRPERVIGSVQDITERKRAERQLRERETLFRTVVDAAPIGIAEYDINATIRIWNPEAERILGWSAQEVIGRRPIMPADEADFQRTWGITLSSDGITNFEVVRQRCDGTPVHLNLSTAVMRSPEGEVYGVVAVFTDVTEQKRAQESLRRTEQELRHAQRMEAIGRLTGGIAHDFNNILTAMKGGTELLLMDVPADSPLRAEIEEIDRAATRAAVLTRQLLAFSRKQVLQPEVVDLNQIIEQLERMLHRTIGADIALTLRLHHGIGKVLADPGQLEQILLNLVVNARDAMPTGGDLIIETTRAPADGGTAEAQMHVLLRVADTGSGMPAHVREHIFEPFFTTKGEGEGTGLGLSTVYGIVTQSGGTIDVQSQPGQGTTFTIALPEVSAETIAELNQHAPPVSAHAAPTPGAMAGTETVLLVEDEDAVRRLAARVLRKHGYTVLEAASGAAALELVAAHVGHIDVLVTDLVMPGMNGRDVATQVRQHRPDLPVLLMSGYSSTEATARLAGVTDFPLLEKPFTPSALVEKIRETLGG